MFWFAALPFSLWMLYGSLKFSLLPQNRNQLDLKKRFHLIVVALLPFLALYGLIGKRGVDWPLEVKGSIIAIYILLYLIILKLTVKLSGK